MEPIETIITTIIGVITIVLTYWIYSKSNKKQANQKQLDLVLELVRTINSVENTYIITPINIASKPLCLGAMASSSDFLVESPLYFFVGSNNPYQITPNDSSLKWDFYTNFHTQPLLPNKIAIALKRFSIDEINPQDMSDKISIILGISSIHARGKIYSSSPENIGTTIGFCKAIKQLQIEISRWLSSQGIKDINFRQ